VLNGFINLEHKMERDGKLNPQQFKINLLKWMSRVIVNSGKSYPILCSVAAAINPDFPTNPFAIFNFIELNDCPVQQVLLRGIHFLGNLFLWHEVATTGSFIALEMLAVIASAQMCQVSLLSYKSHQWSKVIGNYRTMQLLVQLFNQVHAKSIVVQLLFISSVIQIVTTYSIISVFQLPLPMFMILLLELLDGLLTIFGVYGFAGKVYSTSKKVVDELKRRSRGMKDKHGSKLVKSFPELKIGFGVANFIDQTTPLVILSFNNARVVDLLLLKSKME